MSLPLGNVRSIVTHDSCPDGTASALILKDALDVPVRFIQYGSEDHKNLTPEPGMLFCDITPTADRAKEFVEAGAIVLDHHKTARAVVEQFGENGVFADEASEPGVCGAVLAFRHVWHPLLGQDFEAHSRFSFVKAFATLAGVRDTWQKQNPLWEEACTQAGVLHFIPNEHWLKLGLRSLATNWGRDYEWLGKLLRDKQDSDTARLASKSRLFTTQAGTRVAVIPSKNTSDVAEMLGGKVDLLVGFGYTFEEGAEAPILILSTRSHSTFNCASFCRAFGGGGHTRAAGCSFSVTSEMLNPYTFVESLIKKWEEGV